MMKITKRFKTETSHIVRGAVSERCKFSMHGHSYKWDVTLESDMVGANGMVLDFIELKPIGQFIDRMDHATVLWQCEEEKIINFFRSNFQRVVIMNKNTTAENMARLVHRFASEWLASKGYNHIKVSQVAVHETETGCGIATDSNESDTMLLSTIMETEC